MTYAPTANIAVAPKKQAKQKAKRLSREDVEIIMALEAVKSDMEFLHNCFDHTTDAILVDSLVYELKAANLKYQYYLNMCKKKGIVHGSII
ncbi:MAG: YaaL family protein [Defluviitaleaceae bacterium]|nr:YaaL family protein [Defluviitaleaceae bacterium]